MAHEPQSGLEIKSRKGINAVLEARGEYRWASADVDRTVCVGQIRPQSSLWRRRGHTRKQIRPQNGDQERAPWIALYRLAAKRTEDIRYRYIDR